MMVFNVDVFCISYSILMLFQTTLQQRQSARYTLLTLCLLNKALLNFLNLLRDITLEINLFEHFSIKSSSMSFICDIDVICCIILQNNLK